LIERAEGIGFSLLDAPPPPSSPEGDTLPAEELKAETDTPPPTNDPEAALRQMWTTAGVSEERQQQLIADVTTKAQPGAKVGPFTLGADIDQMRESLRTGVQVVSAPQLFPTPPQLAARMVDLAKIEHGQELLEPSAGTGVIVNAVRLAMVEGRAGRCAMTAVEINPALAHRLAFHDCLGGSRVDPGDFLQQNGNLGKFDRIVMNPPFANGDDIKHITHALTMLKPGGRLVAICANGPRQQDKLRPIVEKLKGTWEELPADTFTSAGTGVRTVLLAVTATA
jgi:protein-L-isoaspartate O-methyltransferase